MRRLLAPGCSRPGHAGECPSDPPTPEMSQAPQAGSSFPKGGAFLLFPQMWLKEVGGVVNDLGPLPELLCREGIFKLRQPPTTRGKALLALTHDFGSLGGGHHFLTLGVLGPHQLARGL